MIKTIILANKSFMNTNYLGIKPIGTKGIPISRYLHGPICTTESTQQPHTHLPTHPPAQKKKKKKKSKLKLSHSIQSRK
ncbi:hypothetical protein DsansV1_C08g0085441 [Dioscorea sansibarensis]